MSIKTVGLKMNAVIAFVLIISSQVSAQLNLGSAHLSVYGEVPGVSPSPYYSFRVREKGSEKWVNTFALMTECSGDKFCNTTGYYDQLKDWSNTYINFEMQENTEIEIEITKLFGDELKKAVVHPYKASESCVIQEEKAIVTIKHTGLFTVDINGQMDDQDTGKTPDGPFYDGPPIHTLTIFANPFIQGKPNIEDEGVMPVVPGEEVPSDGSWHTLYFLPGVHDVGVSFPLHKNKSYYIPGDAVVYGTLNNAQDWSDGEFIKIFGHGTLSGDRLPHPSHANPHIPNDQFWTYHPVDISGAAHTTVEGITIANSAYHSLMLVNGYNPEKPTDMRWVKIFTWRGNGDGINPFGNGLIEDCFIRTQDDSTYVNGRGIRRVVYWQDCNGSTFVLSPIGGEDESHPLIVEDCTVVYARAKWHHWSGGRLFNMRGEGGGSGGDNLVFRNIIVEDPRPTLQHFMILMEGLQPYSDPNRKREPGNVFGITFQNVSIAAPSVLGEPEILWGMEDGLIYDLVFENVTIGDQTIKNIDYFYHNEFVLP